MVRDKSLDLDTDLGTDVIVDIELDIDIDVNIDVDRANGYYVDLVTNMVTGQDFGLARIMFKVQSQ